jgi:glycosyltransferase involved in cell wall biosynthesis
MRILHVIDTLDFGGAEKIVVSLANAHADRHDVTVCALGRTGVLASELDARVGTVSLGRASGNSPSSLLRLARLLRDGRFDVVHGHNWSVFLDTAAAAVFAKGCRVIHTIHGPYPTAPSSMAGRIRRACRRWLERLLSSRVSCVVCVSEAIAAYVPQTVGIDPCKLRTIHNGIDARPPAERRAGAPLTFITVGRLDAIKNQGLMLRALASLEAPCDTARLLIVGDGPEQARLEGLASQLGIASRVEFLGFRRDVDDVLARADVFLLSSHYEGISMALLEAMRAGVPCVATRVGGVPETVVDGQTGILTPPDEVGEFARAMRALAVSADQRRQMGRLARDFQQREFSRSVMLERYDALYRLPSTEGTPT